MTDSALRQQISREVKRALQEAGLSARAAAAKMPRRGKNAIDGKLLYRWMNAEVMPPLDRLEQFAQAINQPITLHIGPGSENEPAQSIDWNRLMERVEKIAIAVRADESPEDRAARAAIEGAVQSGQGGDGASDDPEPQAPAHASGPILPPGQ